MISVIVVTYRRKELLRECLKSLLSQDVNFPYEIIVVDNGSCDGTGTFVRSHFPNKVRLISLTTRVEVSICKDIGVEKARGQIIAFTDDDCFVPGNWLRKIKYSIPDYDFIGGQVLPSKRIKYPWWWQDSLNWLIGLQKEVNLQLLPLGCNVAFKKNVLREDKGIIFKNPDMLPQDYTQYGEDIIRAKRALKNNFKLGFIKEMVVFHFIPEARLRISYLLKRSYWEGYMLTKKDRGYKTAVFRLLGIFINSCRFLMSLQLTHIFRSVLSCGYFAGILLARK